MPVSAPTPPAPYDAPPRAPASAPPEAPRAGVASSAPRFLLIGGLNTALGYVLFRLFLHALGDRPAAAGAAQAGAYAVGIALSYAANRRWTFRSDGSHRRALPRFLAAQLGALALSTSLTQLGVTALGLPPSVAWVLVTGVVTVVNFLTQRYWVFPARG